jgi:hemerythrin-like domain-containing protein
LTVTATGDADETSSSAAEAFRRQTIAIRKVDSRRPSAILAAAHGILGQQMIQIGAKKASNFRDPIGLLTDCHRRVERFLSMLTQVAAQAHGGPLPAEHQTALEKALRYFREAAPKHTADEEESLFPRLRALNRPGMKQVLAEVDNLEHDHADAQISHAEVDRLGQGWLASGSLPPDDVARLSKLLTGLAELYRTHIQIEERDVFPIAALLNAAERDAIGAEMAARRRLHRNQR